MEQGKDRGSGLSRDGQCASTRSWTAWVCYDCAALSDRFGSNSLRSKKSGTTWRHANIGRLLNNAVRRFEARVLELMSAGGHAETRIAHVNLTRNLDVEGTRLTELARRASMSKQAMGELVDLCTELGLVDRVADASDRRARIIRFTPAGLVWLDAFRDAVDVAEREMRAELGRATMDTILKGLAAYGAKFDTLGPAK